MPKSAATVISAKTDDEKEAFLLKINKAKDPIHFISFAKKGTGDTRNMVFCMPGRSEVANSGEPTPYDRMLNDMKTNTLTVWDVNKGGKGAYRRINLEDVYSIYLDGTEYSIEY
jgi:hypothetical protein